MFKLNNTFLFLKNPGSRSDVFKVSINVPSNVVE